MSTATTFIPTFAAITLILGGANELSVQLILIGVLAIILHTTLTPADFSNPYPNFDNYHPTDPPLRDYVLVFGLVTLMLIALISRVHPLLWSLVRATWRALVARQASAPLDRSVQVQDATVDLGLCSTPHNSPSSPSTSHTLTNQWTATTSTLADGSPTLITPQAIGVTDSSETATLKNRVSQLEAELEELRCRMKVLSTGEKVFTEPSPSPIDPDLTPFASLGSVDAREHLRSLVEFAAEGTRQTDQLILKMRTILSEADKIDDTAFEACQVGGGTLPVPPTSRSTQSPLSEHLPTTPTTRRVRDTPPPLSAAEAAKAPGTPRFNLTLDFLDLSEAPCSTPLRTAKEVEQSVSPSPSSFLAVLEADFGPQDLFVEPAIKRSKEADTRMRPVNRATSVLTKIVPGETTPRHARNPLARLRERSSKFLYLPPPRAGVELFLDSRRNVKRKGKAVRVLEGMSDWLAERRRRRNIPPEPCPLDRNRQG